MALIHDRDAKGDPGVVFTFPERDKDTGKDVKFRVRRIPAAVERDIERRCNTRIQEYRLARGGAVASVDSDDAEAVVCEKAIYALMDSEGFKGLAEDASRAGVYSTLLNTHVEPGVEFSFDGKLSDPVKRHLFEEFPPLATWVVNRAGSLGLTIDERETKLGKTSASGSPAA